MNWSMWLQKILSLVPVTVQTIQQIHGDAKSGATKKQLAMESLGFAQAIAGAVAPQEKPAVDAATNLVSTTIDNAVTFMKAMQQTGQGVLHVPPTQAVVIQQIKGAN